MAVKKNVATSGKCITALRDLGQRYTVTFTALEEKLF